MFGECFTTVRSKDGSQYMFLPYSETAYTLVVKYVPDRERLVNETDVVDIPYEYSHIIITFFCVKSISL